MAYLDDLITARDRYAADLASQTVPTGYEWNEYQSYLVEQIELLNKLIFEAIEQERASETEVISGGFTP